MNIALENPEMLLLIIPVIIAGFYFLRKTKTKIVEWRMIVSLLLVIALASPYTTVTQTTSKEDPSLVLVQDQTASMGIFHEGAGTDLYNALVAKTPTTLVQLKGDKTSLGDAVTQYSGLGSQIVLVTDGNSNSGKDLAESLEFAKETNTTVYLVKPELEKNDLSVEITGDKKVVMDNQNEFNIVVRQASENSVSYLLEVFVDGELSQSRKFTQDTRNNTVPINQAFTTLGAHSISVKISDVSGGDLNEINNEFFKSIYVIPKPKVTLVTNDTSSPLAKVLSDLYEVSVSNSYPGNITGSKVVVLDNQIINAFSEAQVKEIKNYVSNGGGLVVVGGDRAYNYGNYLNSSLEEILPVVSKPSEFKGGRNLVLILDVSPSTVAHGTQSDILSNAVNILGNDNLKDSNVAVIAFGNAAYDVSGGFVYLGLPQNVAILKDKVSKLTPTNQTETSLDQGLGIAKQMFEGKDGELDAIIISDGGIEETYDQSVKAAQELKDMGVKLYFIHIRSSAPSQADKSRNYYAEMLMKELGLEANYQHINMGERANIVFEKPEKSSENNQEEETNYSGNYPLLEYSPDHFITKGVNLTNANITGYDQVTPKAGAERLVITTTGQPVLTTWRFGLGRVAAFTTDNGQGEGNIWASGLYKEPNSKLISGMVNWAMANPQAEEGAVVDAPDTWLGTPSDLTLIMYDEGIPQLKLDGANLDLALTGRNTYEASVNPANIGIHDISGYPLAVNYALEYLEVGQNKDIESLIAATGGKIYTEKEARASLLKDARQNSARQSDEQVSLKMYVLIAALVLYLGEVIIRRIKEMRKLSQAQGETETEKAST